MSDRPGVPALGYRSLTRFYDPVVALTTREKKFRTRLLAQLDLSEGQRVLDLGCGTGTLALQIKRRHPAVAVTGVDADPEMLSRAKSKAAAAGLDVEFDEGLGQNLPYENDAFDAVVSSLFFHHLERELKERTAAEITRVLRPDGNLHVVDWGPPADPLMAAAFLPIRLLDGLAPTRDNVRGRLPEIFSKAGLAPEARGRMRTPLGTLAFLTATAGPPVVRSSSSA